MNKFLSSIALLGTFVIAAPIFAQTPPPAPAAPARVLLSGAASPSGRRDPAGMPTTGRSVLAAAGRPAQGRAHRSSIPTPRRSCSRTRARSPGAAIPRSRAPSPARSTVTRQGNLWIVKGRHRQRRAGYRGRLGLDRRRRRTHRSGRRAGSRRSRLPGRHGRERHALQGGRHCSPSVALGKSNVWRLAEGDNPCDGKREGLDLVMEKPAEKKPVPPQPKRT
jgi:hypothetical protein